LRLAQKKFKVPADSETAEDMPPALMKRLSVFDVRLPVLLSAVLGLVACDVPSSNEPEPATGGVAGSVPMAAENGSASAALDPWPYGAMVSVANPYAAQAAADVIARGGHAVDAAIAAHTVLGLVEPQSSGIGGGGFMLVYERASNELIAYDGRETAPAGANADMFQAGDKTMPFLRAWQSGLAVGVPGAIALYEYAHQRHGQLTMLDNLTAAITLAEDGFEVSPRLAAMLERIAGPSRLDDNPTTAAYFYPDGAPLAAGTMRANPDYAMTLRAFAAEGTESFYQGALAEDIVAAVRAEPDPGTLSTADLASYGVLEREVVCGELAAGGETICSMPPPSSGLMQIMIMNFYDTFTADASASGEQDAANEPARVDLAAYVDAQRLAYADRDHYVADPAAVQVPTSALIDPAYLAVRATERFAPDASPQPGDPGAAVNGTPLIDLWGRDTTDEVAGTTHFSIVDRYGNAVSMTATVEAPFGSSRMAGGFLLNNQMTDFARTPTLGGRAVANQVAPGKRPRSSMSPVIVFDENGELKMVAGSPGGNSIPAYVSKVLVRVLRGGEGVQAAVDAPNIIARGDAVRVETGVPGGAASAELLRDLGYPVQERQGENSGLHIILRTADGLVGAADPRREGEVVAVP
jgi:gamma-glutamyltranspeptidase/glutathione hydrolase